MQERENTKNYSAQPDWLSWNSLTDGTSDHWWKLFLVDRKRTIPAPFWLDFAENFLLRSGWAVFSLTQSAIGTLETEFARKYTYLLPVTVLSCAVRTLRKREVADVRSSRHNADWQLNFARAGLPKCIQYCLPWHVISGSCCLSVSIYPNKNVR